MEYVWLKKVIINLISKYLPNKGKRMIYVLLCYLLWSKAKDERIVRNEFIEINNRLHLSKRNSALFFTIELMKILIKFEDFKKLFLISRDNIKSEIINHIPNWLNYADMHRIECDLSAVFKPRYQHS